jgi:hypothetical protein
MVNLILIDLNNKHHVGSIQANLSNPCIDALEVPVHAYLLVQVVGHKKKQCFFTTVLHVPFIDQELVKIG